ncbi:MAG: 1-deoxy-D-xylulose-5-phosphate reductoisomerase [Campylobacteraceae bacterium]|jgi:1-deoxy-D-xylulose-5-phosphate reductoisomerase|nr:1-deoxy-D-xylulose-5-phosphate reductoisomerase [Campylobacteraceae bacterium]
MVILGSTGSIGVNALSIAKRFSLTVDAICAKSNVELLNKQIEEFNPKYVAIYDENLKEKVNHKSVFTGTQGILEMIEIAYKKDAILINALVGFAGLRPSLKAMEFGYKLALANKESLVVAGMFFDTSNIIPIDSEHFGLWYLQNDKKIKKLIITASGGSFRDTPLDLLQNMSPENALNHPNWKMGKKITIDSATMTNKLFEILEAKWLFKTNKIDAIIETKSIIHALIDFEDGSTTAHMANADMKLPIAYAILNKIDKPVLANVNLLDIKTLEFREICQNRYPIWQIKELLLEKSELGVVINRANEEAIKLFFEGKISFTDISSYSLNAIKKFENIKISSIEDVFLVDKEVEKFVKLM